MRTPQHHGPFETQSGRCAPGPRSGLVYAAQLAPHKTPARWFRATDLPMAGSGKIQKFRLREQIDRAELPELS
jgi:acyl-CoA synthetase (AMP-forming)/AMP-acid ligase II